MLNHLQRSLTIALILSVGIVVLQNFGTFASLFCASAIALGALQWGWEMSQSQSSQKTDEVEVVNYFADVDLVPDVSVEKSGTAEEEVTTVEPIMSELDSDVVGDIWEATPEPLVVAESEADAVGEAEPTQHESDESTKKTLEPLMMIQLESLPQKKGKRQVWAKLCSDLNVQGGGKVRDAKVPIKAQFLIEKGISPTQLVKAKVRIFAQAS